MRQHTGSKWQRTGLQGLDANFSPDDRPNRSDGLAFQLELVKKSSLPAESATLGLPNPIP
jgi:hypothetical protein